nr:cytochrome c oxidase subunit 3 [Armatimonas sp.]
MSLHALEPNAGGEHTHGAGQRVSMQYENIDQQNESYLVGMWSFLVTEIMFFGGLFLAYSLYRVMYFNTYLEAHQFLLQYNWLGMHNGFPWLGTINTTVLLTSSLFMVLAVYNAQIGQRIKTILWLTTVVGCALIFMVVKYFEYTNKLGEGLYPDRNFNYARALYILKTEHGAGHEGGHDNPRANVAWTAMKDAEKAGAKLSEEGLEIPATQTRKLASGIDQRLTSVPGDTIAFSVPDAAYTRYQSESNHARLFMSIYFSMTGLHGIHVSLGIVMMGLLILFYWKKHPCVDDYMPLEMIGLYWHFVDIVWIFLFPLMYLIS